MRRFVLHWIVVGMLFFLGTDVMAGKNHNGNVKVRLKTEGFSMDQGAEISKVLKDEADGVRCDVRYSLEGKATRVDSRQRITLELIEVRTGKVKKEIRGESDGSFLYFLEIVVRGCAGRVLRMAK